MANKKHFNPYVFGPPVKDPDFFFGREYELKQIVDTIENLPPGLRQSMAIIGPRRIGKSSILLQLKHKLGDIPSPVALISTESIAVSQSILLTQEILSILRKSIRSKELEDMDIEFELLDKPEPQDDRVYQIFRRDLQKLNERLEALGKLPAVLIIDEVEGLQRFGGRDVLSFFRDLCQSLSYILFIVAGSDQLYQLVNDYTSPFFNVFKPISIHSLEEKDARALIEKPAQRAGLNFSHEAVSRILDLSGREPYLINMICHYATESSLQNELLSITLNEVQVAQIKISSENYFNSIWKQTGESEKIILYILASTSKPRSREEIIFDFIDIADTKLPIFKVPNLLHQLVETQILRLNKERKYYYNNQIFPDWIKGKDNISENINSILSRDFWAELASASNSRESFLETILQQDNESFSLVEEITRSTKASEQVERFLTKLSNRIETTKLELQQLKEKPNQSIDLQASELKINEQSESVKFAKLIKFNDTFNDAFALIPELAVTLRKSLRRSSSPPQICSVEFGISIQGKNGLPILSLGKSSSNLMIKLTWDDTKRKNS